MSGYLGSRNHLSVASIAWALKTTVTKLEHHFIKSGMFPQAKISLIITLCLFVLFLNSEKNVFI